MTQTVTIPKMEYELLLKCRHLVDSEFEGEFSDEFIEAVKESEKAYKKGEVVVCKSREEREKLFESL